MADLSTPLQSHETYFRAFLAHYDELKNNLETKQVATKLFQERILTVAQFRAFTKNVTEVQIDYEINHEILNLMMDKTVGDFLKFLNAITLPPSTCRSIGEKIKRVISPTNTDGRSSHHDGGSSHQEPDTQILDKWGK